MAAYQNAMGGGGLSSATGGRVGATMTNTTTTTAASNVQQSCRSMQEAKSHEQVGHHTGFSGNFNSFDTSQETSGNVGQSQIKTAAIGQRMSVLVNQGGSLHLNTSSLPQKSFLH